MKKTFLFILVLLCLHNLIAQTASKYNIARTIPIEGDGLWDYLASDDAGGRLFISHSNVVNVVDKKTGKLLHTITGTKSVRGIALAPEFNKGFTSNAKDTSVTIFDLTTYKVLKQISVTGKNPDAIMYDPFSKKVFVFNNNGENATVINAQTNKVIATIDLEGKPESAVTNSNGKVYVNIENKNEIAVINSTTLKVESKWSILPGAEATGLALDNKTHRLFTVCGNNRMMILNAESGKVVSELQIGEGADAAAFDPELKRAYSSNADGTLTVVQEENENKFSVLETVATKRGAHTLALDAKTHHIYLPVAVIEKPTPTKENPHPKPAIKPGSFSVLDVEPVK